MNMHEALQQALARMPVDTPDHALIKQTLAPLVSRLATHGDATPVLHTDKNEVLDRAAELGYNPAVIDWLSNLGQSDIDEIAGQMEDNQGLQETADLALEYVLESYIQENMPNPSFTKDKTP